MASLRAANVLASLGPHKHHRNLAYGPNDRHQLDAYVPKKSDAPMPVVIFFHGGDWSSGYPDKDAHVFVGDALSSHGFIAVVVNYRRYPDTRFPGFVHDAALAFKWTREHVAELGGDPDKIFVMGHSAGAHIASMIALDERYLASVGEDTRRIRGLIGMAGPYYFLPMPDEPLLAEVFAPPANYPQAQPQNFVDAGDPPMLLLAGNQDTRVPSFLSLDMQTNVRTAGGEADLIVYNHLSHIMLVASLAMPIRLYEPTIRDIARWIDHRCELPSPRLAELKREEAELAVSEAEAPKVAGERLMDTIFRVSP